VTLIAKLITTHTALFKMLNYLEGETTKAMMTQTRRLHAAAPQRNHGRLQIPQPLQVVGPARQQGARVGAQLGSEFMAQQSDAGQNGTTVATPSHHGVRQLSAGNFCCVIRPAIVSN
jgi:hypothetical protein